MPIETDLPTSDSSLLTPVQRLTRDLRDASRTLGRDEARYLVDSYYKIQEDRIRSAHQVRTLSQESEDKPAEPHSVISWLFLQEDTLEKQIRRALDAYSGSQPAGTWCRSVCGIGPVIAAGLLAHLSVVDQGETGEIITRPTAGHFWSFAGLNPAAVWGKGEKRPWNAGLKRLCFLIGESFTKVSNNENDVYGKFYKERKVWETERNERLVYAEQAKASLEAKNYGADTDARKHYEAGRLPPARIHLRAQRYAVKLFLAHLHEVMWFLEFGKLPPLPYVLDRIEGHSHYIGVPNAAQVPGLVAALRRAGRGAVRPGSQRK